MNYVSLCDKYDTWFVFFQAPVVAQEQSKRCCLCCMVGPVSLEATLERSAYCCGENVKLKCEIQNGSDQNVWVICRLIQVSKLTLCKHCDSLTLSEYWPTNIVVVYLIWTLTSIMMIIKLFKSCKICTHYTVAYERKLIEHIYWRI